MLVWLLSLFWFPTSLWKPWSLFSWISPTFPLPPLLCHRFLCYFVEIYLLAQSMYVECSLDRSGSPRCLELYLQHYLIRFPVFLISFLWHSLLNYKITDFCLQVSYFFHSNLEITTYDINVFFLLLKFFCRYFFNQNLQSFFSYTPYWNRISFLSIYLIFH